VTGGLRPARTPTFIAALLVAGGCACGSSSSSAPGGPTGDDAATDAATDGPTTIDGSVEAGPGADGGAATPAGACAALGAAYCGRLEACAPFLLTLAYGDATTCAARFAAACTPAFGASGTAATPAQLEACAQAVGAESCADALDNAQPAACQVMGTLANGAVAGSSLQCQAGYCPPVSGSACCQCTARVGVGSACMVDQDCTSGLVCPNNACTQPAGPGAACSSSQPCMQTLACIGGTCQTPAMNGAPCQTTFECDLPHGGYCNSQTMKCAQAQTAAGGSPCGYVGGNFVACAAGGSCVNGTCVAPASDGASCDPQNGPPCLQPAQCVNGKCMLPSPSMCH